MRKLFFEWAALFFALLMCVPIMAFKKPKKAPTRTEVSTHQPRPRMFVVEVSENNLYNKAQANILKYKILAIQERDTVRDILNIQ